MIEVAHFLSIPVVGTFQFLHILHGILHVLDVTRFRPLPAGLVDRDHPWVTGINPPTGRLIWPDNGLYRSPRPDGGGRDTPEDHHILQRVGRFLAEQVARSAV